MVPSIRSWGAWTLAGLVLAWPVRTQSDPFAFLLPTIDITPQEERRLDAGDVVVRVLPASSGEFAVVLAAQTTADGARLVAWAQNIAELKRSAEVTAIARFSSPPVAGDVRALHLDEKDLAAIRACRPRSCDLKLTAVEMARLQVVAAAAGANWRPAVQDAMRTLVLDRTTRYLALGHAGLEPYVDQGRPTILADVFRAVVQHSAFLTTHAPDLVGYLDGYPAPTPPDVESFAYWSIERIGGRPSLGASHVAMRTFNAPDRPEAVVVGKQIFTTHYVTGALSVTAVLRGRAPATRYLVYVNRSRVDVLDRWYGGLARTLMTGRIKDDAAGVFRGLKTRLESGPPPV